MVLEILCVEPIYPQYSGFLETCLALRYWFFEVLGSESVRQINLFRVTCAVIKTKNQPFLTGFEHTFKGPLIAHKILPGNWTLMYG